MFSLTYWEMEEEVGMAAVVTTVTQMMEAQQVGVIRITSFIERERLIGC